MHILYDKFLEKQRQMKNNNTFSINYIRGMILLF